MNMESIEHLTTANFESKELPLKEKSCSKFEQLFEKNEELMECSPKGMSIEPLQELLNVLSHIKIE